MAKNPMLVGTAIMLFELASLSFKVMVNHAKCTTTKMLMVVMTMMMMASQFLRLQDLTCAP